MNTIICKSNSFLRWLRYVINWRGQRRRKAIKDLHHYRVWLKNPKGHCDPLLLLQQILKLMDCYGIPPLEFGFSSKRHIVEEAVLSQQRDIRTKMDAGCDIRVIEHALESQKSLEKYIIEHQLLSGSKVT